MHDRSEQTELNISDSAALLELSAIVNSSLDLDFILSNVLLSVMGKCMIPRAFVLVENSDGVFRITVHKGLSSPPGDIRFQLASSWHGVLDVRAIAIDDRDDTADFAAFCLHFDIIAIAPMVLNDRMVGLVGVGESIRPGGLGESDTMFLESAAAVAASAVSHALVIDELRATNRRLDRRVQELNTLFEISREMNAMFDEEKILRTLSYALMGQLRATRYIVFAASSDGFAPVLVRHPDFTPKKTLQKGIRRLVDPVVLATQPDDTLPPVLAWLKSHGFQVAIPLRIQSKTEGLLCIGARMGAEELGQSEIEYLSLLASITISSLANAKLLRERLEKQRMEEELQLARTIQKGLLPSALPSTNGYRIYGMNESSRQVGGDYFDVIPLSDHELVIAIGDVSGKGIPASLLMANVQAALRIIAPLRLPLAEATARINTIVFGNTGADKFITFFWGILDTLSHRFEYLNAGHNPPYLVRRDGARQELKAGGLILGILPEVPPYETETVEIGPDEFVFMYTDGVNEALSRDLKEFGNERLEQVLARHIHDAPEALAEGMKREIQKFTAGAEQSDDITMLIFRRPPVDP